MSFTPCRACGHMLSTGARQCPRCGAPRVSGWKRWGGWALGIAGVLFVIGILADGEEGASERSSSGAPPPGASTPAPSAGPPAPATSRSTAPPPTTAPPRAATVRAAPPPPVTDLCRDFDTAERIDGIAETIARRNMRAARRIRARPAGCAFYREAEVARLGLTVEWEDRDYTRYTVGGTLHLSPDDYRWEQGPGNAAFRRYRQERDELKGDLILGGLALAAIAAIVGASGGKDEPAATRKTGTAVTCLSNQVLGKFHLLYRWKGRPRWTADSLSKGNQLRWKSGGSDTLQIRFDGSLASGENVQRTYDLPAARVAGTDPPCQAGGHYEVRQSGDRLSIGVRSR